MDKSLSNEGEEELKGDVKRASRRSALESGDRNGSPESNPTGEVEDWDTEAR